MANDAPLPLPSTTATLTTSQSAALTNALLSANSIPRIQAALQHALQESGWTANLRAYIVQLLRSQECGTYDEVMRRVLAESRQQNAAGADSNDGGDAGEANGAGEAKNGELGRGGDGPDIRVPQSAVREGIRAVRREVEAVCEVTFD